MIFYLCNGTNPECKKGDRYLSRGPCRHTNDPDYVKNTDPNERLFGYGARICGGHDGDFWELGP